MSVSAAYWQELPETPCQRFASCKPDKCDHDTYADLHPDAWYEDPGSGKDTIEGKRRRRAIEACHNDCPLVARGMCLDEGLKPENLVHGIWAGYTEKQRQEIVSEREKRRLRRAG